MQERPPVTLSSRLQTDLTTAIRDRDELRRDTLRMAIAAAYNVQKAAGRELTDDEMLAVLTREVKTRRESIEATDEDVDQEIEKFAARAGRTPAAVRARLEKDGALDRIRAGVRREKTMTWLIEKANVTHG